MKIIQVIASIAEAAKGPSYTVPALSKFLAQAGHNTTLMSIDANPSKLTLRGKAIQLPSKLSTSKLFYDQRFPKDGAIIPVINRLSFSTAMKIALKSNAPHCDIFHVHGIWLMPNVYPSQVAKGSAVNLVLSPRGMMAPHALKYSKIPKKFFWHILQKKALIRVDMFHATSEQEYRDIRAMGLKQPIAIIPNGIELPEMVDVAVKPAGEPKTVLFLARIHPIKRIDVLLKSWRKIQDDFPDWHLKIIGPGPDEMVKSLRAMAKGIGVERANFYDAIFGEIKTQAYKDAELYVLPSDSENFGMTVAESLAAGTPVITTTGTPWSGVQANKCGWWIDNSVENLSITLREAMSLSTGERKKMGSRGRAWMADAYSWSVISQQMADAYIWLNKGGVNGNIKKLDYVRL